MKTHRSYYRRCPCCYNALFWGIDRGEYVAQCEHKPCVLFMHAKWAPSLTAAFEYFERFHEQRLQST